MSRGSYVKGDVDIFLSDNDIAGAGTLWYFPKAVNGGRFIREPLDVLLKARNGAKLTARVQVLSAKEIGTDFRTDRTYYGVWVRFSDDLYLKEIVSSPNELMYSAVYDGGHKINFFRERNGLISERE